MMRVMWVSALLLIAAQAASADTEAGLAAFDRHDYATAIQELKPEAEAGDAAAQARYGFMLVKGLGTQPDVPAGVAWFRKSAAQGDAEGQYMLGSAYDVGDTGSIDRAMAAEWYRKSAEQGYARAQLKLGALLSQGDGVDKDVVEGAAWVGKAAEQDHPGAARIYGQLNMVGIGLDQNVLAARYWLTKARDLGHGKAPADLQKIDAAIKQIEAAGVPRTTGGDGVSPERAIVLPDAKNEIEGVKAEHAVVQAYFGGWTWSGQALLNKAELGIYDEITLTRPGGTTKVVYFNVGNWFGKMD